MAKDDLESRITEGLTPEEIEEVMQESGLSEAEMKGLLAGQSIVPAEENKPSPWTPDNLSIGTVVEKYSRTEKAINYVKANAVELVNYKLAGVGLLAFMLDSYATASAMFAATFLTNTIEKISKRHITLKGKVPALSSKKKEMFPGEYVLLKLKNGLHVIGEFKIKHEGCTFVTYGSDQTGILEKMKVISYLKRGDIPYTAEDLKRIRINTPIYVQKHEMHDVGVTHKPGFPALTYVISKEGILLEARHPERVIRITYEEVAQMKYTISNMERYQK